MKKWLLNLVLALTLLTPAQAYSGRFQVAATAITAATGFTIGAAGLITTIMIILRAPTSLKCDQGDQELCCGDNPIITNITKSCHSGDITNCTDQSPRCLSSSCLYYPNKVKSTDNWAPVVAAVSGCIMIVVPLVVGMTHPFKNCFSPQSESRPLLPMWNERALNVL